MSSPELSEDNLNTWKALREWLERDAEGRRVLAHIAADPARAPLELDAWLRARAAQAPPPVATYISGGEIQKIINIAQAGVVNLQLAPRHRSLPVWVAVPVFIILLAASVLTLMDRVASAQAAPAAMSETSLANIALAPVEWTAHDPCPVSNDYPATVIMPALLDTLLSDPIFADKSKVDVRSYAALGGFSGADGAMRLAERALADIVVYGSAVCQYGKVTFQPRFFLGRHQLGPADADVLVGHYSIEAITPPFEANANDAPTYWATELGPTTTGLVHLIRGFASVRKGDWTKADQQFKDLRGAIRVAAVGGQGTLHDITALVRANARLQLGDVPGSRNAFSEIPPDSPLYWRSQLGLDSITYRQATTDRRPDTRFRDCNHPRIDRNAVDGVIHDLEGQLSSALADGNKLREIKTRFRLATVFVCLYDAPDVSDWNSADASNGDILLPEQLHYPRVARDKDSAVREWKAVIEIFHRDVARAREPQCTVRRTLQFLPQCDTSQQRVLQSWAAEANYRLGQLWAQIMREDGPTSRSNARQQAHQYFEDADRLALTTRMKARIATDRAELFYLEDQCQRAVRQIEETIASLDRWGDDDLGVAPERKVAEERLAWLRERNACRSAVGRQSGANVPENWA